MKIKTFIFYIIILFFQACTPEPIGIDIPQAEPKLVVYSQALPDQALVVALSKSFSALAVSNNDEKDSSKTDSLNNVFLNQFLVDNGIITISGPDYTDTLDRLAKGVYLAPFFPYTPGNVYQLSAFDPVTGFTVSSSTNTLEIVSLDTISAIRGKGDDSLEFTISFKVDDPIGENYYLLNVYEDSIPSRGFFNFSGESNTNSISFSDREYPNGELQDEQKFYGNSTADSVVVTLTNISRAYFDYIEARKRSGNSLLSEPITFPSNIVGGYGYFNIHFPTARVVVVE